MRSIRVYLIATILAVLTLFNFVAALRGYQSSMEEADKLFDEQLLEISHLVARLDLESLGPGFRLGNNLAFQVWRGGELISNSHHAPQSPIAEFAPGFSYANFDGYRWRTYTLLDEPRGDWVMVAERSDLRFVLAENVVLESVMPILLSIPLIGLLVWAIVSYGLRPLRRLSAELKNKQAGDLSPVGLENSRQELRQVVASVNGFIARLSHALEREKRFSADAAHELRTPISALKIQLHNLAQDIDTGNESYQQLQQGVERLQHLVEQLLALYRVTPDQFAANCGEVDLYQLARDVIVQLYPTVEEKKQGLELTGERVSIRGEPFALETMIRNLISNASKYTQAEGEIRVHVGRQDKEVCLVVEDNGPGIRQEERARVFDRFYRGGARQQQLPGCGLGLTIVKLVADLHQASLSLEDSHYDTGCAFRVCFPG